MIFLLAAVPEETAQIRQVLQDCVIRQVHGLTVYSGRLHGQSVCLAHGGVGKAAVAAAAATLMASLTGTALWLIGCGGAYPGSGLGIGDLALADQEIFGDEGVMTGQGFLDLPAMGIAMRQEPEVRHTVWPVDQGLHDWALACLGAGAASSRPKVVSGPFLTVSTCTGSLATALELESRSGAICENMEGAAAALACRQFAIPFLELRGISNRVDDRDLSRWDLPAGMQAAQRATLRLLDNLADPSR